MIKKINTEFERIISVQSSSELYVIFFRLVQAFAAVGIIYLFFFVAPLFASLNHSEGAPSINVFFLVSGPIGLSCLYIALAEFALWLTARKNIFGVLIGLLLCLSMLTSWQFLIGLFGFYCFLNPGFQQKYLADSPEYFQKILVKLNIHKIDSSKFQQ